MSWKNYGSAHDELIHNYLEGETTLVENLQFRLLLNDPDFCRRVAEYAIDLGSLLELAREKAKLAVSSRSETPSRTRRLVVALAAVAATFLLALSVVFLAPSSRKTHSSTAQEIVAEDGQVLTVYVTKTGTKYHTAGCRYLGEDPFPISISEAQSAYSACSACDATSACAQESAPPTAENAIPSLGDPQATEITVYVTVKGNRYHQRGCQYLEESSIRMALSRVARDYSPCSRCCPPTTPAASVSDSSNEKEGPPKDYDELVAGEEAGETRKSFVRD